MLDLKNDFVPYLWNFSKKDAKYVAEKNLLTDVLGRWDKEAFLWCDIIWMLRQPLTITILHDHVWIQLVQNSSSEGSQ